MNSGLISRHENKGNISYKDPESCPRSGNSKGLKLSPSCDLTKVIVAIHRTNEVVSVSYSSLVQVFVKAVREIGEPEGSSLRYYSVLDRIEIF